MSGNCGCGQVASGDDEEKKYAYAAPLSSCRSLILLTLLCRCCEQETYIISIETWPEPKMEHLCPVCDHRGDCILHDEACPEYPHQCANCQTRWMQDGKGRVLLL